MNLNTTTCKEMLKSSSHMTLMIGEYDSYDSYDRRIIVRGH